MRLFQWANPLSVAALEVGPLNINDGVKINIAICEFPNMLLVRKILGKAEIEIESPMKKISEDL